VNRRPGSIPASGTLMGHGCATPLSPFYHHMPQVIKSVRPPSTRKHFQKLNSKHISNLTASVGFGTLAHTIWFQNKARSNQPKVVRSGFESLATENHPIRTVNLPQDVLEVIVADLGDDILTLKGFSLTCYSWYIAAVPHLHRTVTLEDRPVDVNRAELKPLAKLHKMELLPFTKKLVVRSSTFEPWLSPRKFDRQTLRCFSALTNVQKLRIERFDLSKFIPDLERYFGHFTQTIRSISLTISSGTQMELLCFLGLFPKLDDIEIEYYPTTKPDSSTPNPGFELAVPFSVPSLRGQLKLTHFTSETVFRDMITLFGGLRFRYMDLFSVEGSRLLLEACADTLQTVRVYPSVPNSTETIPWLFNTHTDEEYRDQAGVAPSF
jgi:hypothetical protein